MPYSLTRHGVESWGLTVLDCTRWGAMSYFLTLHRVETACFKALQYTGCRCDALQPYTTQGRGVMSYSLTLHRLEAWCLTALDFAGWRHDVSVPYTTRVSSVMPCSLTLQRVEALCLTPLHYTGWKRDVIVCTTPYFTVFIPYALPIYISKSCSWPVNQKYPHSFQREVITKRVGLHSIWIPYGILSCVMFWQL